MLIQFHEVVKATMDVDKRQMQQRLFDKLTKSVESVDAALRMPDYAEGIAKVEQQLLEDAQDLLSDWLDKKHGARYTPFNNFV